jgi:hypothetical protein
VQCDVDCSGALDANDEAAVLCGYRHGLDAGCCADPCACDGDLVPDGEVNMDDLTEFQVACDRRADLACDINCDSVVDSVDEDVIRCQWGGAGGEVTCCAEF